MSETRERVRGVVLWFAEERGWGLVRDERGHLFHLDYAEIAGDGLRLAYAGQAVEFEPGSRSGRAVAVKVTMLETPSGE